MNEFQGRLMPGRLLLVDTQRGEVIKDEELKHDISTLRPVSEWLNKGLVTLKDIHDAYNKVRGLPQGTVSVTRNNSLKISIHQDRLANVWLLRWRHQYAAGLTHNTKQVRRDLKQVRRDLKQVRRGLKQVRRDLKQVRRDLKQVRCDLKPVRCDLKQV